MRTITIVLLTCAVPIGGWAVAQGRSAEVTLACLGHSCFTFHAEDGPIVMIDPYGEYVPYPALPQPANLGTLPFPEQIAKPGDVEVLFVPVGGVYTIGADQAVEVVKSLLSVRIVVPIHYFIEGFRPWPLAPVDDFVDAAAPHWTVHPLNASEAKLNEEILPDKTEVWVMHCQE